MLASIKKLFCISDVVVEIGEQGIAVAPLKIQGFGTFSENFLFCLKVVV